MSLDKTFNADGKLKAAAFENAGNIADEYAESRIQSIEELRAQLRFAAAFRNRYQRPFITVSYAQSIDGSIALKKRDPIALSGPQSLVLTHQIRACCDSILIGIGTVLSDDPQLSVRSVAGKNPQPIILDTRLRTPLNAKLLQKNDRRPWIINGQSHSNERTGALKEAGAKPVQCPTGQDGKIDLLALMDLLADMKINSVMVEGGARVITSFVNSRLVDLFIITITPKLVGGLPVLSSKGLKATRCLDFEKISYQRLGNDIIIWARPAWENR